VSDGLPLDSWWFFRHGSAIPSAPESIRLCW
jgi:hypothetical protein